LPLLPVTAATTVALLPAIVFFQDAPSATPPGWRSERVGSDTRLTPTDVPAGKTFTLTLQPPAPLGDESLRSWFSAKVEADAATTGTLIKGGEIVQAGGGRFYNCVRGFRRPRDGAEVVVMYIAARRSGANAQFSRIVSSPQQEVYQRYLKDALQVALTGTAGGGATPAESPGTGTKTAGSSSTRPLSRMEEKRRQYTTAPGAGVKPSQIEGVFAHTTMQAGVGGGFYMVYEPLLALKDGTYYEDLDVPPSDLNATVSRQLRPKAWGKWRRKSGGGYETLTSRGWESARWIGPYAPVAPGTPLSGSFSHIGGGGNTAYGGGTMIAAVNSFNFHPNGRFEGGSTASVSSHEPGSGTSVVADSNRSNAGTYKLDGYVLTLRYNDGRVDRRSFVWMDEKKRDAFYLNGSAYLQEEKNKK